MGRIYIEQLEEPTSRTYKCVVCGTDVCFERDFFYKDSLGIRRGEALLFRMVKNVYFGTDEEKLFLTGNFITGSQIYCKKCGANLGWRYLKI